MTKATPDSRRLSQLSEHEDPHQLGVLFRSAKGAQMPDYPRLRWRLRTSLRQGATRPRRFLHIALIAGVMFLSGGIVGAVVGPYWAHKPAGPAPKAEPPAKTTPQAARRKSATAPAEAKSVESSTLSTETSPVETVATPVASHHAPVRFASQRVPESPPIHPDPILPPETPRAPRTSSPIAVEQALLGDILKSLRKQHDPLTALALLQDHAKRFPDTVLGPEAAMLRAEALLGLGRNAEALSVLDRLSLGSMPNQEERLVLRGELRAVAGRWREAREDFETPLRTLLPSGMDAKSCATKERALWGRASVRSHLGDEAGARTDLVLYLRTFPSGQFATQAAALLQGSP